MSRNRGGSKLRKKDRKMAILQTSNDNSQYRLPHFQFKSENQSLLYTALQSSPLVIGVGVAGTGKSLIGCRVALEKLIDGHIDKIVVTRNPLPVGESLGFFKGTDDEKMQVWLAPVIGTIKKILRTSNGSDGYYNYLVEKGKIIFQPLETVKGSSYDNAFIILEESQECTVEQIKNLTTRAGENTTIFLNGDLKQSNVKNKENALGKLINIVHKENELSLTATEKWNQIQIPVIEFKSGDICRSDITRKVVEMFDRNDY